MNALLLKLVLLVFIVCGLIMVLMGMDVGSSDHPSILPGVIVLVMANTLLGIQQTDKAWNEPLVHPWEWVFSAAGWGVAYYGCRALIEAVAGYYPSLELGNWFWSAVTACAGLFLARVGIALRK